MIMMLSHLPQWLDIRIIGCDPKVSPTQTCCDEEANNGCVLGFSSVLVGMMSCPFHWHDLDRLLKNEFSGPLSMQERGYPCFKI
jgi:hypothetical protein